MKKYSIGYFMALHIQQMVCGDDHSLVLLSDESVWAVGSNTYGQLGDGTRTQRSRWKSVIPSGSGVVQVAAGCEHSLALKSDGSVWTTGLNNFGQLGDGCFDYRSTWISVMPKGRGVIQVSACGRHSLVLKSDGSVWATGYNEYGQLGDGVTAHSHGWKSVILSGVTQVAVGAYHSLALKADGSVWVTGYNGYGQLGDRMTADSHGWKSVIPSGVTQVAAGAHHSLALKSDGSVWATGRNLSGQLGDGTITNKSTWISVISSGVTRVAAGAHHSLALKSDGSVWATGLNCTGQLGDGAESDKMTWTSVIASGITHVAAGYGHSLALKSDGTLWKTGTNHYGQLGQEGDGSTVWIPDRFFEQMLLESLMGDSGSMPERMPDSADDWRGLSL
jgi:alpha-tubulin suppressor-like RCC1 family protein